MENDENKANNIMAKSMNSEAFSHFSLPSNNFYTGMRVGVGLHP